MKVLTRNGEVAVKKGRHKDDVITDAKQLIIVAGNLGSLLRHPFSMISTVRLHTTQGTVGATETKDLK